MKKNLNVFCVLMLLLLAAKIVISFVCNFSEYAKEFKQGWEDGGKADVSNGFEFLGDLLMLLLALACLFLLIRSFIAFIRFLLNVNRDKVFVWENIPLLRWTGWGILIPTLIFSAHDLLEHIHTDIIFNQTMDDFIFSLFCLIMAEVFAIGLKLKEESDLTI